VIRFIGIKTLKRFIFKIDTAQYFRKKLILKSQELINAGVNNVIVSGPPHSLFYHAAILKSENPNINLILDYRDAWNDESTYSLYQGLKSVASKEKSISMELISLIHADKVIFNTNDMRKRSSKIYSFLSEKFMTLHNFFDEDDYLDINNHNIKQKQIVYLGSLDSRRRKALEMIAEAIFNLNQKGAKVHLKFVFYSNVSEILFLKSKFLKIIQEYFTFYPIQPSKQVPEILSQYEFCLSVNKPNYAHAIGAKVFDYMAMKKKIFHISNGGELFDLLQSKNHYVAQYSVQKIEQCLTDMEQSNHLKIQYDFDEFNLNKQTKTLLGILN
jgi:glycosyltransferase involved in cell wall biosynthesis